MKNAKKYSLTVLTVIGIVSFNAISFASNVDVDPPTFSKVSSIASNGIDYFFGGLGGFAVIAGGIEFYKGFLSYKDSVNKGGYGESKSNFVSHIIAGVLCLIGAVVAFVVLGWTKDLFNI